MSDDLVNWHKEQASRAMNSLSCGSENWEYREARKQAAFHREAAAELTTLRAKVASLEAAIRASVGGVSAAQEVMNGS